MRIWHRELVPLLCRQHLLGAWREGLGCYNIVIGGKQGYRKHPQVQMYLGSPHRLWEDLQIIRNEMLRRGYKPKELPPEPQNSSEIWQNWQTLEEQRKTLRSKGCACEV